MNAHRPHIIIVGAGIGGLTAGALLAQAGCQVTVLEAGTYPGGSAGTFFHQGYRFDAGATLAGGFHANGPHTRLGEQLGLQWPIRPADRAWTVHLPDRAITLDRDHRDVLEHFPNSAPFWHEQAHVAGWAWDLAARGLPWPPTSRAEWVRLARSGLTTLPHHWQHLPLALTTAHQWLQRHHLAGDRAFMRFLDAQLLISAQTTSAHANALFSATALDLPRQGVQHVEGGMGALAQTLADKITALGGQVLYKHRVTRIAVDHGRAHGVHVEVKRRESDFIKGDFVIANLTPWSLHDLLAEHSPARLRRELDQRAWGWGAFVLYLGLDGRLLPADFPDHHQIITSYEGSLGEGRSIFVSLSPAWDTSRAPAHHRAVTITTHTAVQPWWELLASDPASYEARRAHYRERILSAIEQVLPGFKASIALCMDGTPVTYQTWTHRYRGMVGGFPQESLFRARGPRTGLHNVRLVGDSIFPGQSTAGVTVGAMRVAQDVMRTLSIPEPLASPVNSHMQLEGSAHV